MQIYLIGFMGTGKTSTGIELSKLMQLDLLDSDEMIVKQENKSIPEIFKESGEDGFRRIETDIFKRLSDDKTNHIISCGGGAPLRDINVSYMRKNGKVIRLIASPETIYERVKDDNNRPLLKSSDPMKRIIELMSSREDAYKKAADITIDTDGRSPYEVAMEIQRTLTKLM